MKLTGRAHTPVGASEDEGRRRISSRRAERAAKVAPSVNAGPWEWGADALPYEAAIRMGERSADKFPRSLEGITEIQVNGFLGM